MQSLDVVNRTVRFGAINSSCDISCGAVRLILNDKKTYGAV